MQTEMIRNTAALFVAILVAVPGCSAIMPLTQGGGANTERVTALPSGLQIVDALFNASVPERNTDVRTYAANDDAVWGATLGAMKSLGNPIVQVDRQGGTITTDYQERRGFPAVKPWRDKYYVTVSPRGDGTVQVGIKRTVEEQEQLQRMRGSGKVGIIWREAAGLEWTKKQSNGSYESYLLTLIANQVAGAPKISPVGAPSPTAPPPGLQPSPQVVAAVPPPTIQPPTSETTPILYVKTQFANMRVEPSTNAKVLAVLKKGMKLTVLHEKDQWYRIKLDDGKEGWVAASVTSLQPE